MKVLPRQPLGLGMLATRYECYQPKIESLHIT